MTSSVLHIWFSKEVHVDKPSRFPPLDPRSLNLRLNSRHTDPFSIVPFSLSAPVCLLTEMLYLTYLTIPNPNLPKSSQILIRDFGIVECSHHFFTWDLMSWFCLKYKERAARILHVVGFGRFRKLPGKMPRGVIGLLIRMAWLLLSR